MKIVDATIFVALYGTLRVHPWLRDATSDQDAYSLFSSRATSMGWSSAGGQAAVWGTNDAGQEWGSGDVPTRVAWFQVGTADPAPDGLAAAPILACARETVARVGELNLAAVQMLLPVHTAGPATARLLAGLNWFLVADPSARTEIRVTVDSGDRTAYLMAPDIVAAVQHGWTEPFRVVGVSGASPVIVEPAVVDDLWMGPTRNPVVFDCSVPEWTVDAVGWLGELFVEGCRRAGVRTTVLVSMAPAPRR